MTTLLSRSPRRTARVMAVLLLSSAAVAVAAEPAAAVFDPLADLPADRAVEATPIEPSGAGFVDPSADQVWTGPAGSTLPPAGRAVFNLNQGTSSADAAFPVTVSRAYRPGVPRLATAGSVTVEIADPAATNSAGVSGLLAGVTASGSGEATVSVDYSGFAERFGGAWGTRLTVVELPVCALTTPHAAGCLTRTPIRSSNQPAEQTISAQIRLDEPRLAGTGGQRALAVVATAAAGGTGDYRGTDLSPAGSWMAGGSDGAFTYDYPLRVPPSTGPVPDIALGYSSASHDGRTSGQNNQASSIGDGWEYEPGFIERSYPSCTLDDEGSHNNPDQTGDLCWDGDGVQMTLSLNGSHTTLIRDATTGQWRGKADANWRIELLGTPATPAAAATERWRVTTPDGTTYHFSSEASTSGSRLTVPVFGNHSGEPCHASSFAGSSCRQAYRWLLDKVVDVHGNMVRYTYAPETGHYGAAGDPDNRVSYHRASQLERIDYGLRADDPGVLPTGRVVFTPGNRCLTNCGTATDPVEASWPDVPFDLDCRSAPCTSQLSPVFFTTNRLAKITTQVRNSGAATFRDVDSWTLDHEFKDYGDAEQVTLWLKSIQYTGHVGAAVTLPKVQFGGEALPNRVDAAAGVPVMWRTRVFSIKTETGAVMTVGYAPTECTATSLPADKHANTMRCFPVRWTPEFFTEPIEDWFHKHAVTSVVETDTTGGGVAVETQYEYSTAGGGTSVLWAFDDSEFTEDKHRTYNQWRGYAQVTTRRGDPSEPQAVTRKRFYRGLDGQPLPGGGTRNVSVTDHEGNSVADHQALAGQVWESVTLLGASIISGQTYQYWTRNTATQPRSHDGGDLKAWLVGLTTEKTRTLLVGSTYLRSETRTTFDTQGRPTEVNSLGDTAKGGDESCTRTEYADNASAWIKDAISRVEMVEVGCGTTPSRPGDIASDTRTFFDGSTTLGAPPVKGSPTRIDVLDRWESGPVYVTSSRTGYDPLGRVVTATDSLNNTTSTAYTPSGAGPVTQTVVTNPLGHTLTTTVEPAWGQPTALVEANARRTELAYDGIGRSTAVWLPGRNRAAGQTASKQFEYLVWETAPSAVVTRSLNHAEQYVVELALFDSLLRPRQTQTETADHGRLVTETVYDTQGRVDEEFGPNHNTSPPSPAAIVRVREEDSARRIGYFYDAAGRVTDEVFYNKQVERWRTTTTYGGSTSGFLVSVQPPQGAPATATLTDAHGRVVKKRAYHTNAPSGAFDTLAYEYSPVGRLEAMTDHAGNQWGWEYDLRGRQTVANDPDAGTTTMTYDPAGRLATSTDARGETVVNGYDQVGRQVSRRDGNGTLLAEWEYDTAIGGKGALAKATRWVDGQPYVNQVHRLNPQGLVTQTSIVIPAVEGPLAGRHWFTTTYNPNGQIDGHGFFDAGDVEGGGFGLGYDHVGNPISLVFDGDITGTHVIVDEATFTPFGEVATRRFGAGTERHAFQGFVYEEGTRRLQRATFDREASLHAVADLRYSHDPAGNILSIADVPEDLPGNHELQCFQYDHKRRLSESWAQADTAGCASTPSMSVLGGPAPYWNSYAHDVTGNRTGETIRTPGSPAVTRTYTYPAAGQPQPHTVRQVAGTDGTMSFDYDEAGNTTGRTIDGQAQTLQWDVEGNLSEVEAADPAEDVDRMIYTADGQRLLRDDGEAVTVYMPQTELTWNRSTGELDGTRYFSHAGQVVAVCTGQDVADWTWLGADQHGNTTTHAVNAFTAVEQVRRLDPYGNQRGTAPPAWPGQQHFVGGVQDPTGLIQAGARPYDPVLGRFITVDPILAIGDGQQINGYTYANGNPVTGTDPTGMLCAADAFSLCPGQDPRTQPAGRPKPPPPKPRSHNLCVDYCGSAADNETRRLAGWPSNGKGGTTGPVEVGGEGVTYDEVAREYGKPWGKLNPAERREALHDLVERNRPVFYAAYEDGRIDAGEAALVIAAEVSGWADAERCIGDGDWGSCAWLVAGVIPHKKLVKFGHGLRVLDKLRDASRFCSFPGDTHVLMADGTSKPISEVQPGDKVLAAAPETGEYSVETITAVWVHEDTFIDILVATISSSGGSAAATLATITTTPDHPFWNATDQQWQPANTLDLGDHLFSIDRVTLTVLNLAEAPLEPRSAYNLTTTNTHTYYVLADVTPVLVHNTCGPNASTRPAQIADYLGYSTEEVKDAIHAVKRDGLPRGGAQRNPDVIVDLDTGEVYVQLPDGSPSSDSIGNIFDHLRERQ